MVARLHATARDLARLLDELGEEERGHEQGFCEDCPCCGRTSGDLAAHLQGSHLYAVRLA